MNRKSSRRPTVRALRLGMLAALLALPVAEIAAAEQARSRSGGSGSRASSSSSARSSSSSTPRAVPRDSSSTRTPSTRHRSRGRVSGGGGRGYSGPFFGGRYGYPWGYYHPYSYYSHYSFYRHYPYYPWGMVWYGEPVRLRGERAPGAFDLNVKPRKTEVYIDGEYAGTVGRFDGFPGYLWVVAGSHELVFHRPGYETVVRRVTARPGIIVDLRFEMQEGETRPPEELMARPPAAAEAAASATETPALDVRGQPARFRVSVLPADSVVYLDGRYLGSGDELGRLHAGLLVNPGSHQLEVVRPGFAAETLDFEVEAGEEVQLEVELERVGG